MNCKYQIYKILILIALTKDPESKSSICAEKWDLGTLYTNPKCIITQRVSSKIV